MGYRNGTLDLLIFSARYNFHGLFVELKVPGGRVSDEQNKFIQDALYAGYATAVCWDYEETIATINKYLEGPNGQGK